MEQAKVRREGGGRTFSRRRRRCTYIGGAFKRNVEQAPGGKTVHCPGSGFYMGNWGLTGYHCTRFTRNLIGRRFLLNMNIEPRPTSFSPVGRVLPVSLTSVRSECLQEAAVTTQVLLYIQWAYVEEEQKCSNEDVREEM